MINYRVAVPLLAGVLVLSLGVGTATAYWTAGSIPGGNGASAAGAVAQGAKPTAVSSGSAVTVSWAATALSSGDPVSGYTIKRYDAASSAQQDISSNCAGLVVGTNCTENAVPTGRWTYTITPRVGAFWTGAESAKSDEVSTDPVPPTNVITVTDIAGGAYRADDILYYRGADAGSFRLTNAVSDSGSGPASSQTTKLAEDRAGWTHDNSTVSAPVGGPYVSNEFSWTAATTSRPTEAVIGWDVAGNSVVSVLNFIDDSVAPTAGTVSYADGYQAGQAVVVSLTSGTDTGSGNSGIGTRQLQRASAPMTGGTCGAYTAFSDIGPDNPESPYVDDQVTDFTCYVYRFVVADRVQNLSIATTLSVAKVDSSVGGPPLRAAALFSILGSTGVVSTGATMVSGDLGLSPSGAITGFPPGIVAGTTHNTDTVAAQGKAAFVVAYDSANARTWTGDIAGDLGGQTFIPGVYHSTAAIALTGTVTLDGGGDPNSLFIFQGDAAMNTAAAATVVLINGASAANVYWQIEGAVGTGATTVFAGTILAAGAITLGAGTQLTGRALSYGTVTMAGNSVRFTTAPPPTILITGGGAVTSKDTTPTISGTTDAAVGRVVTVTVGGQVLTTAVRAGQIWSVTATTLTAGLYPVVASVRDAAGNNGTANQTLRIEVNPNPVTLSSSASYSVLAATGVDNTGVAPVTTVSGDLGLSPSGAITGFPSGIVAGTTHDKDAAAAQAQFDSTTAYNEVKARKRHFDVVGNLAGQTFHAGIYHSTVALALTGTVTLDGENNPNAVFIFQGGAAMTTAASAVVLLINGASAANVYWQVVGAFDTGASTVFAGTIMSGGAVTLGANTELTGRALSFGTVTMASNTVRFTTAPASTITITSGASAVSKDTTPTISGLTTAAVGRPVTVSVNGQLLATTVQAGQTWSVTAATLTAGLYRVVASVRDADGNNGIAEQTLKIEVNPNPVVLGAAASYAVLAGTGVVSTGAVPTSLTGDLGLSPAGTIFGFPPGVVVGSTQDKTPLAEQAQTASAFAYNEVDLRRPHFEVVGDLAGQTFHTGIYYSKAALALTGTVTLDAENNPNAIFIFQGDAALTTAASAKVLLVNGASAANVYWQIQGAVDTGASTAFAGTILSAGAVTLGASTQLTGRVLCVGTVTMASNVVTVPIP